MNVGEAIRELTVEPVEWPQPKETTEAPIAEPVPAEPEHVGA